MGVKLWWANDEKVVLHCRIEAPWTWDDLDQAWTKCHEMAYSVKQNVTCVMDGRAFGSVPKDMLQRMYDRYTLLPSNFGIVVVVGAPNMFRVVIDVLRTIRPDIFKRYHFVATMEDAERLVTSHRVRVP